MLPNSTTESTAPASETISQALNLPPKTYLDRILAKQRGPRRRVLLQPVVKLSKRASRAVLAIKGQIFGDGRLRIERRAFLALLEVSERTLSRIGGELWCERDPDRLFDRDVITTEGGRVYYELRLRRHVGHWLRAECHHESHPGACITTPWGCYPAMGPEDTWAGESVRKLSETNRESLIKWIDDEINAARPVFQAVAEGGSSESEQRDFTDEMPRQFPRIKITAPNGVVVRFPTGEVIGTASAKSGGPPAKFGGPPAKNGDGINKEDPHRDHTKKHTAEREKPPSRAASRLSLSDLSEVGKKELLEHGLETCRTSRPELDAERVIDKFLRHYTRENPSQQLPLDGWKSRLESWIARERVDSTPASGWRSLWPGLEIPGAGEVIDITPSPRLEQSPTEGEAMAETPSLEQAKFREAACGIARGWQWLMDAVKAEPDPRRAYDAICNEWKAAVRGREFDSQEAATADFKEFAKRASQQLEEAARYRREVEHAREETDSEEFRKGLEGLREKMRRVLEG